MQCPSRCRTPWFMNLMLKVLNNIVYVHVFHMHRSRLSMQCLEHSEELELSGSILGFELSSREGDVPLHISCTCTSAAPTYNDRLSHTNHTITYHCIPPFLMSKCIH